MRILVLATLFLLLPGCDKVTVAPEGGVPLSATSPSMISRERALAIASADAITAYRDLSPYTTTAAQQSDGWHVDYELPTGIQGGGPHYIIDARTGAIVHKRYEQ